VGLWRQLTRGLRNLTDRTSTDRDIADEVDHYLAEATAAHLARGLSPNDARRAAMRDLGGVTGVREEIRGYGWENVVAAAIADLRYAARSLKGAPGFTTVTVLTLALGIGGATAIFGAVKPMLFDSLPYPHAARVVMLSEDNVDGSQNDGTFGMYRQFAERARTLEAVAVMRPWTPSLTGSEIPQRLEGQRVSASYFRVLGVLPHLGSDLRDADDRQNGPNVVVISDSLWRRQFGGDPALVGGSVTLDGQPFTVVGVMPATFQNVLAPEAEVWSLLQYGMAQGRAWGHHLKTVARIRPEASVSAVSREVDTIGRAVLEELRPATYGPNVRFSARSLQDDLTRGVRPALFGVMAAVTIVLMIACVNVTNLLVGRGVHRRPEFALRTALGAGRGRLVRQLLTESLLVAWLGGAAGLAVAALGVRALVALSPPGLPRADAIDIDAGLFVFAFALTTLVGLAFGMIPAVQASRHDPHSALQHGSRRTAGGHRRARAGLVVTEVALAFVLLVNSGLLMRSLEQLLSVNVGFDSSNLLTMQVFASRRAPGQGPQEVSTRDRFAAALAAVGRVPGVIAAGFTSQLPISGDRDEYGVRFGTSTAGQSTFRYAVSPGYLETMRIPLRRGRLLNQDDRADAPLSVLINESFANRQFSGADPIGQQLSVGPAGPYTIVGVVGDVRQLSLAADRFEAVYMTVDQWPMPEPVMSLAVRANGSAASLAPAVRAAIWSVDKNQPIVRVSTADQLLAASAAERRFALSLFEAFAFVALCLATAGLYGVLSGGVAERTREIGVRAALGASRANILSLVFRTGAALTALGAIIGLAGALLTGQAIASTLFGVTPHDAVTYSAVIAIMFIVSAAAALVPAWRAARVDPAITLRAE
jgi:putative ABC transport system permease protein